MADLCYWPLGGWYWQRRPDMIASTRLFATRDAAMAASLTSIAWGVLGTEVAS